MIILLCLCGGTNFGQTRIDQISQLLTFGVLELEHSEDSFATSESHHWKTSEHQLSREVVDFQSCLALLLFLSFHDTYTIRNVWQESEQLEFEKREIIGMKKK